MAPYASPEWLRMGELHNVVHLGVKRALAEVASHYEIDLERVCEGYVLPTSPSLPTPR